MNSFRTKSDAYQGGYNHGLEDSIMRPRQKSILKWEDVGERFNVAGVQYSDYQLIAGGLKPGTVVQLNGEPNNPHDRRAIRIEYNGIKLGYIPRQVYVFHCKSLQYYLWELHNCGYKLIGVITAFNKSNPTWDMIMIQVRKTTMCPKKEVKPTIIKF